jgi:hypothetical protein
MTARSQAASADKDPLTPSANSVDIMNNILERPVVACGILGNKAIIVTVMDWSTEIIYSVGILNPRNSLAVFISVIEGIGDIGI